MSEFNQFLAKALHKGIIDGIENIQKFIQEMKLHGDTLWQYNQELITKIQTITDEVALREIDIEGKKPLLDTCISEENGKFQYLEAEIINASQVHNE